MKLYAEITVMVPLDDEEAACNAMLEKLIEIKKSMKPKRRPAPRKTARTCLVDGCHGHANSRGMCDSHYNAWYKQQPKNGSGSLDQTLLADPDVWYNEEPRNAG